MGRHKNNFDPTANVPAFNEEQARHDFYAADELARIQGAVTEEQVRFSEQVGAFKMAAAAEKFLTVFRIRFLVEIKEANKYKGLVITDKMGNVKRVCTWEEFCNAIGYSKQLIDENIRNYKALGEEALEALSQVGMGYRELKQLRKLPIDQRTELIEAAKAGDKDTLLELAEDMIAKHAALQSSLEGAQKDCQVKDELISAQSRQINDFSLKEIRARPVTRPWDEMVNNLRKEISSHFDILDESAARLVLVHDAVMKGDFGDETDPEGAVKIRRGLAVLYGDRLNRLFQALGEVRYDYERLLGGYADEMDNFEIHSPTSGES